MISPASPMLAQCWFRQSIGSAVGRSIRRSASALPWLTDETELDAMIIGPAVERAPAQFRAVIDDQDVGVSPLTGHAFQHVHDPLTRQREVHLDGIRHCA